MTGRIIIFLGPSGAGKSVQAQLLVERLGFAHISSGELLRHDPALAKLLVTGELAPSRQVEEIITTAIQAISLEKPLILDGFPRTMDEVVWLYEHANDLQRTVSHVVLLDVSQGRSLERLMSRGRDDDDIAAFQEKWLEYERATKPVIEYYRTQNVLTIINGEEELETVYSEIAEVVQ